MKASIDGLVDNLERQVKRYREKRRRRPSEDHPLAKAPAPSEPPLVPEPLE
jgi:ribosome-associated translation inhibitor RaiA